MNRKLLITSLTAAGLLLSINGFAASSLWEDRASLNEDGTRFQSKKLATSSASNINHNKELSARKVTLNSDVLNSVLSLESNLSARPTKDATPLGFSIPLPEGGEVSLKAVESSVMSPELAKQFPSIKTWRVTGENDSNIHGRVDRTERGFHAMVVMPDGDTIFIEPEDSNAGDASDKYLSFSKKTNYAHFKTDFQCKVHPNGHMQNLLQSPVASRTAAKAALSTKVYRLAVATTGEYTQFHGGSKSSALSAIVTTINRVNEIYERDLSVSFNLIAGETDIIYTSPSSDPYSNDDVDALIDENVLNLNFGALNASDYDIGHVFGAGEVGGLAAIASVCDNDSKAAGATGIDTPTGDVFSIGYVAHELGHQLGAAHTFNSECGGGQRTAIRAVEPGSGSTIMSYAGVCEGGNDLQNAPDAQFHAISILDVLEYTRNDDGRTCGSLKTNTNQEPEIDAGADVTIPTRTPFMLVAKGSDADGDSLRYTWEQTDAGTQTDVDVDAGDNAIFRTRALSKSSTRYIPRLSDLFDGVATKGERLPVEDRDVKFVATVRDGKGGLELDSKKLTLSSTGRSFAVTSHRSSGSLSAEDKTTVSWDVAGTNSAPISCSQVNISLIQDNGQQLHLAKTSNDGEHAITLPKSVPSMSRARFMVACTNNSFFNVSLGDIKVGSKSDSNSSGGGSTGFWIGLVMMFGLLRKRKGN